MKPSGTTLAVALPVALVPALGAIQGGYLPDTWVWATPIVAWLAALGALLGGYGGALRRAWLWPVAGVALLGWTAASTLWSAHAAQSLLDARRTTLYVTLVLALLVLARRLATETLVRATFAAITLLLLYALGRHLLVHRRWDYFEGNLLYQPLGYSNAVGILATLGMLLGTGVAARARSRAENALATATLPLLALALVLSGSRASALALALGGVVLLLLGEPGPLLRTIAIALPGAALLAGVAAATGLASDRVMAPYRDGPIVAAVTVAAVAATFLAAARLPLARDWRPGPRVRRTAVALALAAVAVAIAFAAHTGASEPRASYWHVAWKHEVVAHPLLGTGAGTFGVYWVRSGLAAKWGGALDTHSLYLEALAELGPLGLLLLLAFLLLPLRSLVRRLPSAYAPAAAGAYVAWLVHAGLDWDWEMPAVVIAALTCGAALLLGDEEQPEPPVAPVRAAAIAAALVLGACGLAGARSDTVPAAAGPGNARAPLSGALDVALTRTSRYGLP